MAQGRDERVFKVLRSQQISAQFQQFLLMGMGAHTVVLKYPLGQQRQAQHDETVHQVAQAAVELNGVVGAEVLRVPAFGACPPHTRIAKQGHGKPRHRMGHANGKQGEQRQQGKPGHGHRKHAA